jgi:Carbonic anhydrase
MDIISTGQVVIPSDPLAPGMPLWTGAPPVQTPFAPVLGCSEARVPIEPIFDQSPNDLFVIRVTGHVLGVEGLGSIDDAVNPSGGSLWCRDQVPRPRSRSARRSATVSNPGNSELRCSSRSQPRTFFSAEITVEWLRPPK